MKIIRILHIPNSAQYNLDIVPLLNQFKFETSIFCYRTIMYTYIDGDFSNCDEFKEFINILETSANSIDKIMVVEYEDNNGDIAEDEFIFDYYDRATKRLQFVMV